MKQNLFSVMMVMPSSPTAEITLQQSNLVHSPQARFMLQKREHAITWAVACLRILFKNDHFRRSFARRYGVDHWNGRILKHTFPELFSFAINKDITLYIAKAKDLFQDLFNILYHRKPLHNIATWILLCNLCLKMMSLTNGPICRAMETFLQKNVTIF
jgi:hypothetical protein